MIGDECNDSGHAPAKCQRSVAYYCSSPSKVDPSGVARMPRPTKKNGEVFRRHTFPPFWLMNSKTDEIGSSNLAARLVQSYRYHERAAHFVAFEVEFREGGEQRG